MENIIEVGNNGTRLKIVPTIKDLNKESNALYFKYRNNLIYSDIRKTIKNRLYTIVVSLPDNSLRIYSYFGKDVSGEILTFNLLERGNVLAVFYGCQKPL